MSTAGGAQRIEIAGEGSSGSRPPADAGRFRARYRVVTRRSLVTPPRRSPTGFFRRPIGIGVLPVLFLIGYVLCGTLAMRGGYYLDELRDQVRMIRIERAELEAEKRRLQAPGIILQRAASELGMRPADRREFARLPAVQRMARRPAME